MNNIVIRNDLCMINYGIIVQLSNFHKLNAAKWYTTIQNTFINTGYKVYHNVIVSRIMQ